MCNWATDIYDFLYNHESSSHANLMSCISDILFQHLSLHDLELIIRHDKLMLDDL